jgi:N6-L-threonylcarbamoyladenine synthase
LDLSFSGLKSYLNQNLQKNPNLDKNSLAAEVIEAVVDSLVVKTKLALNQYPSKSLILAGGVAANQLLRDRLTAVTLEAKVPFYSPLKKYCTDNAAMIGAAALMRPKLDSPLNLNANPSLEVV